MNPNPIDDMEYQFSKLQEDCIEQQLKIKQLEDGKKEVFKYLRHHNYISESVLGEIELIYDSIAKKALGQK